MRMAIAATLALLSFPALAASPDCSKAAASPSSECKAKLDYCHYTSITLVLAFRHRLDGKTEDAALAPGKTDPIWYVKNRDVVKDIVHRVYTNESFYQKMKAQIDPSAMGMARATSALIQGCNADTKVTVESH